MTPAQAKQIIDVLATGVDPETGEVVPADSPLNSPHVIRALFLAARALQLQCDSPAAPPPRPKAAKPANAGCAWDDLEIQRLVAAFDAGANVAQLARDHQRTAGAIRARLVRLGRLQPDELQPDGDASSS